MVVSNRRELSCSQLPLPLFHLQLQWKWKWQMGVEEAPTRKEIINFTILEVSEWMTEWVSEWSVQSRSWKWNIIRFMYEICSKSRGELVADQCEICFRMETWLEPRQHLFFLRLVKGWNCIKHFSIKHNDNDDDKCNDLQFKNRKLPLLQCATIWWSLKIEQLSKRSKSVGEKSHASLEIMTFHHLNYRVRNLFTTNTQDANYGSWVWKSEWNAVDNLRIDDHDCHIYIRYIYTIYVDRCKQSWRRGTKCCGESALAWGETQVRGSNGSCGDDDEMCPPWCCST